MDDFKTELRRYRASHPGTPLGRGYPLGATLRLDGESHHQMWCRVLRADPCTYCGGLAGTVDHVEPQDPLYRRRGLGSKYDWLNLVGACDRCNASKGRLPLLLYLARCAGAKIPKLSYPPSRAEIGGFDEKWACPRRK